MAGRLLAQKLFPPFSSWRSTFFTKQLFSILLRRPAWRLIVKKIMMSLAKRIIFFNLRFESSKFQKSFRKFIPEVLVGYIDSESQAET